MTWPISSDTCVAKINASETCKSTALHEKRAERCYSNLRHTYFQIRFSEFCIRKWAWCCFVRREESIVENKAYCWGPNRTVYSRGSCILWVRGNWEKLPISRAHGVNMAKTIVRSKVPFCPQVTTLQITIFQERRLHTETSGSDTKNT